MSSTYQEIADAGFRTAYTGRPPRVTLECKDESLTKQSFTESCDINNIMAKYQKTGVIDHVNEYGERYGEATAVDFHSAMNVVTRAQEMFNDLPSSIRNKFANDPAQFLEFVQNPANSDELVKLGLAHRNADVAPATPQPGPVDPVPAPAPEAPAAPPQSSPGEPGGQAPT